MENNRVTFKQPPDCSCGHCLDAFNEAGVKVAELHKAGPRRYLIGLLPGFEGLGPQIINQLVKYEEAAGSGLILDQTFRQN